MTNVFVNARFISLNDENDIFSVMVVSGKEIVYMGYNTPLCYDDANVIDLKGNYVIPLVNDLVFYDVERASCTVLEAGQRADFMVLDKNILSEKQPRIITIYRNGKKII